jgi:hypothetical protein
MEDGGGGEGRPAEHGHAPQPVVTPALGPGRGHEPDRAGPDDEPERGQRPSTGERGRGAGVGDSVCVA